MKGKTEKETRGLVREYSGEELEALNGVIDYAEKMIYRDQQQYPYTSLRRGAYGKTVIVETKTSGRQSFRLSQTPAVITPNTCGYATPHSPVGRLCSYVRPGDRGENQLWGEWKVTEIRLFDRYDGVHFEENVRNFLKMQVVGDVVNDVVYDLASLLRQVVKPLPATQSEDAIAQEALVEAATFVISDPDMDESLDLREFDESEDEPETGTAVGAEYFGLSEMFYVNRTKGQDEIIARSPIGAMFVEGVAGSGKTSAALGRTKMLCDFDANNVASEAEFRALLGPDAAYWDGRFAGQFSQESSVGFVRTGELIQYLKETCRRIDLPNLPVLEYKELQIRLRAHRGLIGGGSPSRAWTGSVDERASTIETTMAWLCAADAAMGRELAAHLRSVVPDRSEVIRGFEDKYLPFAIRVVDKALSVFSAAMETLARELERDDGADFRLARITTRFHERLAKFRKEVLGKDVLWLFVNEITYTGSSEADLAQQLIRDLAELYDRRGARFVWVGEDGPLDDRISFVDASGTATDWNDDLVGQLTDGRALLRDGQNRIVKGIVASVDDLYLRLLPSTSEKVYRNKDDALMPLKVERGLGRVKIPLKAPEEEDLQDDGGGESSKPVQTQLVRRRSIDSRLRPLLLRRMLAPLRDMGGLYENGLANHPEKFQDARLVNEIREGLRSRRLTESDVDLILCMFQIAGRAYKAKPIQLSEPQFFQSVFIDEVQDFSEQQVFLMAEQARPEYRAVTAVGDLAQKLHNGTAIDVRACLRHGNLAYVKLNENLRQAGAPGLALFSACFREAARGDSIDQQLVKAAKDAGPDVVRPVQGVCANDRDLDSRILRELGKLGPNQTVVVVFPNPSRADEVYSRLKPGLTAGMISASLSSHVDLSKRFVRHFATIENTKGLEFDVVLVAMLDNYDLSNDLDRNRLYVGITRAKQRLILLSGRAELSPFLSKVVARYQSLLPIGPTP